MNLKNHGILRGRLTKDPQVFTNKDGSKKVMFTLAVAKMDRKAEPNFIPVEAFVSKDTKDLGPFGYIYKGSLVSVSTELRSDKYEKDGETVYSMHVHVTGIEFDESKSVTEERLNRQAE